MKACASASAKRDRNRPHAISGVDMALWDIKAKRANIPLYQIFGGKMRSAVQVYGDAGGSDGLQTAESVARAISNGYQHVRLNYAEPGAPSAATSGMPLPDGPHAKDVAARLDDGRQGSEER